MLFFSNMLQRKLYEKFYKLTIVLSIEQVLKAKKEGNMMDKTILQNTDQQYSYIAHFPATRARD